MKTTKTALEGLNLKTSLKALQATKENQQEQNYENCKNVQPREQQVGKNTNLDTPYTREELVELLNSVEDYILDARNIRVPHDRYNLILNELLNLKYTRKQFSLAQIWLKKGKFPISKTTLDLSDFYPDKKTLEQFSEDIVSRDYMVKSMQNLKTWYEIEISKIRKKLYEDYVSKDIKELEEQYQYFLLQEKTKQWVLEEKLESLAKILSKIYARLSPEDRQIIDWQKDNFM